MKTINEKNSKIKTEVIKDIKKRNLKVVLHRYDYFPTHSTSTKSELIQELLSNEKAFLKLHQTNSEKEANRKLVQQLVEQKKADIFINTSVYNETENETEANRSIGSPPVQVLHAINKRKEQQQLQNVRFAVIPKHKITRYFALLSSEEKVKDYEKELTACLAHMNSSFKPYWNSPSCILKAINDSILRRKWTNLTHLVLLLMNFPVRRYAPLIRYICQLMSRLHPGIQENGLQDQFRMIQEVYRRNR